MHPAHLEITDFQDFPGGPVVKMLRFHCRGAWVRSLIREVPHASRCSQKKKNHGFSEQGGGGLGMMESNLLISEPRNGRPERVNGSPVLHS